MGGLRWRRLFEPVQHRVPVLSLLLGACAEELGPPRVPVASVEVSPATVPLVVTTTVQLSATSRDQDGNTLTGRQVAWSTSDEAIATVTSSGLVTGVSLGSATITATSEGRQGTAAISVAPGPAAVLVFISQPSSAGAGAPIDPALQVAAHDAHGYRATDFTGLVTVAIATNPAGATLSGTTTVTAVSGVATFSDLWIDKSAPGYTLQATSATLSTALSAPIEIISGATVRIEFTVPPTATTAGALLTPSVQVIARDSLGNLATGFTADVTVALGTNPSGGLLSGTTTVSAVAGTATFTDLRIDLAGSGYTLVASAAGQPDVTSGAFDIIPSGAVELVFTMQPVTTIAGAAMQPVEVTARDVLGNTAAAFAGSVTIVIGTNPSGGLLSGTTTVTAVSGIATFTDLRIDLAGPGYTLVASAAGQPDATSGAFDIIPGPADELAFTLHPVTSVAGVTMQPVEVTAQDAQGNPATTFAGSITIAIGTNPSGGVLSGVTTVTATSGVATFSGLAINVAGTGYTLSATAVGLTTASSVGFDITPAAASQLVFTGQPTSTTAGDTIAAIQVTARDVFGNPVLDFTGPVSVAIAPGTGTSGATLAGTVSQSAVNAVASFGDLTIDKSGPGYQLMATAAGVTSATSAVFAIHAGVATQLAFTVEPSTVTAGSRITPQVEVMARDALGNTADSFTGAIVLAIGANPSGGTLLGTTTVAAVGGVAAFADLMLDSAGSGYTLTASAAVTTGATSIAFDVTTGQAGRLVFSVQPTNVTAGAPITPAVEVTARDSLGNTVTSFTGDVVLTITAGTGASGAVLAGTTSVTAVAGVATFSTLRIGLSGTGYQVSATGAGEAGATSDPFDVLPGAAARLVVTAQPTAATAAMPFTPVFQVAAEDSLGNRATSFTGTVTVTIATNPGGGVLSGTTAVAALAGVAVFPDLSINKSGSGYTLLSSAVSLPAVTSDAFDVLAGAATQLIFTVQPTNTGVGLPIVPAVQVTARDAQGNRATGFAANVTVTIGTNPVGGVLSGTTTVAAVAGVATYADLIINKKGNGYRLAAAATGLSGGTSSSFNIITASIVLVGAGDIADCSSSGDEATARLLDNISGTVFTAGDNAYPDGTTENFSLCYQPSRGRHKARTRPSPGNHDYNTSGAAPYYAYFGSSAGPAGRGYYSFDLGDWHIISLNSNISMTASSAQVTWLVADLAATRKSCVLAYWHHPRFSSSSHHGNHPQTQPLWDALYTARAEIVISAHDHTYERFDLQKPDGTPDASRGIREFVVGTGGRDHYDFGPLQPNSQVRNNTAFGVLKLTLGSGSYSWQFIPVAGASFTDSGSGTCR